MGEKQRLLEPNISSHTWHSCWHLSPPTPTPHRPCQLPFMRAFYLSKSPFRKTKSALLPIHWPKGSPRSGGKGLHQSFLRLPLCTVHPSPTRCVLPLGSLPYLCHRHFSTSTVAIYISQPPVLSCGVDWEQWVGRVGMGGSPVVSLSHFRNRGGSLPLAPLEGLPMGEPPAQRSSSSPLSTPPTRVRMPRGTASAMPVAQDARIEGVDTLSLCSPGSEDLRPDPS